MNVYTGTKMEMQTSFEGKHQFAHSSGQYTGALASVFTGSFTFPVRRTKSSNFYKKSIQKKFDIIHSIGEIESIRVKFLCLIHFQRHLYMPQTVITSVAMKSDLVNSKL